MLTFTLKTVSENIVTEEFKQEEGKGGKLGIILNSVSGSQNTPLHTMRQATLILVHKLESCSLL